MTRILHCADLHVGMRAFLAPGRADRLEDHQTVLRRVVEAARDERVDLVLFAGDTWDGRRPTPSEQRIVAECAHELRLLGIPCALGSGNHDGKEVVLDPRTETLGPFAALDVPGVRIFTDPAVAVVEARDGPVGIAFVPYPHKRALDAELPDRLPEERTEEMGVRLERLLEQLADRTRGLVPEGRPTILLAHVSVAGVALGSEQAMRWGSDVMVRGESLRGFDYAALGHHHRGQQVAPNAWYPGSASYVNVGEYGQDKHFLVVDVVAGKLPEVREVASGARPLVKVEASEDDAGNWSQTGATDVRGAIVWLAVHPRRPIDPNVEAAWLRAVLRAGAYSVRKDVDRIEQDRSARIEMDSSTTPEEALRRHFEARGLDPEPHLEIARRIMAATGG